ncbi:MAG: purine-nucleoside phosphorylase [bacterium]
MHIDLDKLPHPMNKTVEYLNRRIGNRKPEILVVLGSGLGEVLADTKKIQEIPYSEIPGIPVSTVSGHKGIIEIAEYKGKMLGILRGRFHTYEGYSSDDVVRLIRSLVLLGAHTAIVTNAAGSTSQKLAPGSLMLIKDHINMGLQTPLVSNEANAIGEKFIDLSDAYTKELRTKIMKTAKAKKMKLSEGVYAAMKGPQYETAAEVKMLNKLGADVVGMSTALEVIALKQLGVKVVGISTVSNYGTGVTKSKPSHDEVKKAGKKVSAPFDKLLKVIIDII